jgi:hypothetical protein
MLLRGTRGRELEAALGTAKKAAGIDAGVMGRDALVWSGLVLIFGCRFRLRFWPLQE